MSDNLLIKSFLFEVVHTQDSTILSSFTLVLPPQRLTIREPQRVSIVKTFGNAFVDDYGADNIEMTISGMSGTALALPTFQPSGQAAQNPIVITGDQQNPGNSQTTGVTAVPASTLNNNQGFTSQSAFYTFRDSIIRYKDNVDFDQYELRVYDLGDGQAYKCILLDFTLDRTSDLPFRYPFTIRLFVYARMGTKDVAKATPISTAKNPIFSLTNITNALNSMNNAFPLFQTIQNIKNQVSLITQQVSQLEGAFTNWLSEGQSVIESPLWLAKTLIASFKQLNEFVYSAYTMGLMTVQSYMSAKEVINDQWENALSVYGYAISNTPSSTASLVLSTLKGMDYTTNPSVPLPTSNTINFTYTGLLQYTVQGADTLQSIAQSQLGNSNDWIYIAWVNPGIASNADLVVGSKIFIPIQKSQQNVAKDQFIISENIQTDTYGTDIMLDSQGNIIVSEGGDLAVISGMKNLLQALNIRLNTLAGSMIKQTAFGLVNSVGLPGTAYALNYAVVNFKDTLIQDPRVASVSNVQANTQGDAIFMSANITPVSGDYTLPINTSIGLGV
jgi:hypothetical protein